MFTCLLSHILKRNYDIRIVFLYSSSNKRDRTSFFLVDLVSYPFLASTVFMEALDLHPASSYET